MTQATGAGDMTLDSFKCWLSVGVQALGERVVVELLLRDGDVTAIDWKLLGTLSGKRTTHAIFIPPSLRQGDARRQYPRRQHQ